MVDAAIPLKSLSHLLRNLVSGRGSMGLGFRVRTCIRVDFTDFVDFLGRGPYRPRYRIHTALGIVMLSPATAPFGSTPAPSPTPCVCTTNTPRSHCKHSACSQPASFTTRATSLIVFGSAAWLWWPSVGAAPHYLPFRPSIELDTGKPLKQAPDWLRKLASSDAATGKEFTGRMMGKVT